MSDLDDLLQKKLADLENGLPLDEVIKDLPPEAEELISLIRLAGTVHSIQHPVPLAGQVSAQRQRILAAAEANTRPIPRPAPRPNPHPIPPPQRERTLWNWFLPTAFAGAAVLFLVMFLAGGWWWLSGRNMNTARVETVTGQVQVATNSAGTQWKNIDAGYRLRQGQQIRTLGASSATLVFYEGSHTFISANAQLKLARVHGSSGRAVQVEVVQSAGETWNRVTPLQGASSFFLVQTPSGTASVHGTSFAVHVSQNGFTQFMVDTGEVRVKNQAKEVTVLAGQIITSGPTGSITDPNYLFDVQGTLTSITGAGQWTVSGVSFQVIEGQTLILGQPALTQNVRVSGFVDENGDYIAQVIETTADRGQAASITGPIESMGGDTWLVNGAIITVSDGTAGLPASSLDPGLQVGDPVKVTFNVLEDGTWLAERIVSLVEEPQVPEPAPSPTATADPLAMPGYQFTPDEMVVQSCGNSTLNITGVLQNDASQSKDYAANLQIGYLIDRGGEQVSSVELLPDHWQRIEAGQSVPFNVHVVMNDRWSTARPGDEVKLRIFPVSATNRPDHLNGQLTITIRAGCEPPQEPYPPVIQPPAESPIPAEPQKPLDPAAPDGALCTGTDPHPTGLKLAQRYAVTYEEIMKWFCEGRYGFGEIDLAYSLSRQSNKPVEEIFTLRASGLGWGDIKKQVLDGQKLEKDTPYTPESDVNGDGSIDHKDDVDGNGYITGNDKKMWKDQQDKKDPHNKDDHKDKEKDKGKDKGSGHE